MSASIQIQKELIILTEHFAPSTGATAQLITDLVEDLHKSGVSARVLTATSGSSDFPYPVLRLTRSSARGVGLLQKLLSGLVFFFGASFWLYKNIQPHQRLLIISNPPFIGLIGLLFFRLKKIPYVFLFQDIFPRSASLTGILPVRGPLVFFWRSLLNAVLINSRATVVLSASMIKRCQLDYDSSVNLVSIPNWSVFPPQSKAKHHSPCTTDWDLTEQFIVQYSGNFGRLHEIIIILEAARLLQGQNIKFVFVGGGAKSALINQYRITYGLTNILMKPYQPRSHLADSISSSDLSIVSLIPGAQDTVAPSKFYGILACSRPVLLIAGTDSELASIINQYNCGAVIPHGDVSLLSEKILFLKNNPEILARMGRNAGRLYQNNYGRVSSTSQYFRLFTELDII